jgi:predicted protein tyrosine phosphatase
MAPRTHSRYLHHFTFIEPPQRHMTICSLAGALRQVQVDKGYWNIVSIRGAGEPKTPFPSGPKVHYACFDDIENPNSSIHQAAQASDLQSIFKFISKLSPASPLLFHCQMGISRSTAVAMSWILRQLPPTPNRLSQAVDILLTVRPQASPNHLVLSLGLGCFMPANQAVDLADQITRHPRIERNWLHPFALGEESAL